MTLAARVAALATAVGAAIKAQRGKPITVANFAALPASVTEATLYYVSTDVNNNNEPALYLLIGTQKLWLSTTPV